jgi:hypothetical protein
MVEKDQRMKRISSDHRKSCKWKIKEAQVRYLMVTNSQG